MASRRQESESTKTESATVRLSTLDELNQKLRRSATGMPCFRKTQPSVLDSTFENPGHLAVVLGTNRWRTDCARLSACSTSVTIFLNKNYIKLMTNKQNKNVNGFSKNRKRNCILLATKARVENKMTRLEFGDGDLRVLL